MEFRPPSEPRYIRGSWSSATYEESSEDRYSFEDPPAQKPDPPDTNRCSHIVVVGETEGVQHQQPAPSPTSQEHDVIDLTGSDEDADDDEANDSEDDERDGSRGSNEESTGSDGVLDVYDGPHTMTKPLCISDRRVYRRSGYYWSIVAP